MTTATAANLVPFVITVKELAKAKNKDGTLDYKLVIEGSAFNAPRPQTIWGLSLEEGDRMELGSSYAVLLARGALAGDGKYDGAKPWMYNWRWGGFNPNQAPAASPPPPPRPAAHAAPAPTAAAPTRPVVPAPTVPAPTVPAPPDHETAMNKRTALMQATEFSVARLASGEKMETFHLLRIAEYFFGWLQGTPPNYGENEFALFAVPAPLPESAASQAIPQGGTGSPDEAAAANPRSLVERLEHAMLEAGWDRTQLGEFIAKACAGRTWSRLTPQEQESVTQKLEQLAAAPFPGK